MKCFNCGKETAGYLCTDCRTEDVLDIVFSQISYFDHEYCDNPYIVEYVATLAEEREERKCIPEILSLFSDDVSEYYRCRYYWLIGSDDFEQATLTYLSRHEWAGEKSQRLISYLLKKYIRNDFIKPRAWCDWIAEAEGVYCELYDSAAMYYAMIAEYNLSDSMIDKGLSCDRFLYSDKEKMNASLEKKRADTLRYRTKKPYWPTTEERRRAVAMFYDEKGISYPRIESKPTKIPESDFEPIRECFDSPGSYCAFWCADAFSVSASKPIYQIAAVKVENGKKTDCFQSYIRPWEGIAGRKSAAKEAGVPLSVIEGADDVDQVITSFFEFVGNAVLVSTDALGNQAKLLSRAARYAGMKRIENEFFDLLDLAADTDAKFDLKNNNREFILNELGIAEGTDALSKAEANISLCEALNNYGE